MQSQFKLPSILMHFKLNLAFTLKTEEVTGKELSPAEGAYKVTSTVTNQSYIKIEISICLCLHISIRVHLTST